MHPRIAVVNDDAQFLRMMEMLLEDEGYSVTVLYERDQVLEWLRGLHPDLIILDIRMDAADSGWIILDELIADPLMCSIPVIVCSADHAELERKHAFLQDHEIGVLPKPFNVDALYEGVGAMLRNRVTAEPE